MDAKRIALLGSTGSIGTQTLDVIGRMPERFSLSSISGNGNIKLLAQQARQFRPGTVVTADKNLYAQLRDELRDVPVSVEAGPEALLAMACDGDADTVVTALIGYAGLEPTAAAIRAGKEVALANKETLVVAGELIMDLVQKHHTRLTPVDSEHSAIWQCLKGEEGNPIEKILLTASGGPFRGKSLDFMRTATPEMALRHPSWNMGARITIASANMMNKGYEVIEAKWLFGVTPDQIEVLVHPQSIVHSAVQFADGTVKAQLGVPDMRLPIQYALTSPQRPLNNFPRLNLAQLGSLTFEAPDTSVFRCLPLAYEALRQGGTMPCIMNAANEVAISAFLEHKIGFLDMALLVERTMQRCTFTATPQSLDCFVQTNAEAHNVALSLLPGYGKK